MTEETTYTDLACRIGRFHRLHLPVAMRTKVRMSVVLRRMLDRSELDAAIVKLFTHEVSATDLVLFNEGPHWFKQEGSVLPDGGQIPFLSFDDDCLYRQRALEIGQDEGALLETVFECSSAAGIVAGVLARLGMALLSERQIWPEMEIIRTCLPSPPELAYVERRARKARNPALDSLIARWKRR